MLLPLCGGRAKSKGFYLRSQLDRVGFSQGQAFSHLSILFCFKMQTCTFRGSQKPFRLDSTSEQEDFQQGEFMQFSTDAQNIFCLPENEHRNENQSHSLQVWKVHPRVWQRLPAVSFAIRNIFALLSLEKCSTTAKLTKTQAPQTHSWCMYRPYTASNSNTTIRCQEINQTIQVNDKTITCNYQPQWKYDLWNRYIASAILRFVLLHLKKKK